MMEIHLICAARPNFMKIAPLYHALRKTSWAHAQIVHTGQHYDPNMSDAFFEDLGLPRPDLYLGVGSGTHAAQTAKVLIAYEEVLLRERPDLVIVVGDVNSTMAATLAAAKLGIRVAHLEAGLRSFDRSMPEEINRLVTDVLADILWTPSQDAVDNLIREGISPGKIQNVGNIMIDSLEMMREKIERQDAYSPFGLQAGTYGVVTLHRPSNVDDPPTLCRLWGILREVAEAVPIVFPVHPRTRKRMEENHLLPMPVENGRLHLPEPLNYIRFMNLVFNSAFVLTDSGGIQEETSYLGIPCLTLRENTERPITVELGTSRLVGNNPEEIKAAFRDFLNGTWPSGQPIPLWDGKASHRVVKELADWLNRR